MDERIKELEETAEANSQGIVRHTANLDEAAIRLPALDTRATDNGNMIALLDTRIQGNEASIAAADTRSA